MLDLLNLVFIFPIEFAMRIILEWFYGISGSYGGAIIALSLLVNLIMVPFYHIAEKWQVAERNIKAKLAPKIKEIKTAYRGQERFFMLRTLYRQHNYQPIIAVRTSFGFLITIPFFIAAYSLLHNYDELAKTSYSVFQDLSQPDGGLQISNITINIMPFIMTFINFLAAYIYAKNISRSETVQIYIIAIIFFVLLYKSPVALVIYWTANNIFSLVRSLTYVRFNIIEMQENKLVKQTNPIND